MAEEFEKIADEMIRLSREGEEQFLKEGKSDKHAKRGVKLIQKEKYEEAERELAKASQKVPDNWHVWYHLGMLYRHLVRMDEALVSFQKAAALQNIDAYHRDAAKIKAMMVASVLDDVPKALELADRLMQNKEYEYAIRAMDIALRKAPELDKVAEEVGDVLGTRKIEPAVLENKAFCLTQLGRTEEAVSVYERIVQLDPNKLMVQLALGASLLNLGREEEGFSRLEKAAEIAPDDARVWYYYGEMLYKGERYDDAVDKFEKCFRIDSNNTKAAYRRACCLAELGRVKEALSALEWLITLDYNYRAIAGADAVFKKFKDNPEFKKLTRS
ncbi:MAG: tetratricopeptide repeat protein [Candidatus Hermodarchaeota archaeon]